MVNKQQEVFCHLRRYCRVWCVLFGVYVWKIHTLGAVTRRAGSDTPRATFELKLPAAPGQTAHTCISGADWDARTHCMHAHEPQQPKNGGQQCSKEWHHGEGAT